MRRRMFALLVFACTGLFAQTGPLNLNFESGQIGQAPSGWWGSATAGGFQSLLTDQGCLQGQRCALMTAPSSPPANAFGILAQNVPAGGYLMRRVRFRAAVRVEGDGGRARLWLRIDRRDASMIYLANSPDIISGDWKYYQLDANVTSDADQIVFGFLLYGGRAWADDASFESIAQLRQDPPEAPRAATDTGLENLAAFARLLGYVRFFHPSDQVEQVNWDLFAIRGARAVEDAGTPDQLAELLRGLVKDIAPTLRIFAAGSPPNLPAELRPQSLDGLDVVRWNHYGVGLGTGSTAYRSTREKAPAAQAPDSFLDPSKPYEAEIGRGLSVRIPLTLYADSGGTLPHGGPAPSNDVWLWSASDRATRLGGVILAWSVLQHFYPYFDVVDADWPAELTKALSSAATDTGSRDYLKTLQRLNSGLHDGHGNVSGPDSIYTAAIMWDWAEDQLIVTRVKSNQIQGLARGDRVIGIDGRPVEDAMAEMATLVSGATPQWVRWVSLQRLTYCDPQTRRMQLEIEPYAAPGSRRTVNITCGSPDGDWNEPRPAVVQELEPGIVYVDINRLTDADWRQALPKLEAARGIIFDLRGYPRTMTYIAHLTEAPVDSAQWHIPTPSKPDRADLTFYRSGWSVPPAQPYLKARRVFMTDGRAISFAETVMGIVEAYRLADILGGTTAGTNGNVNSIPLPGGYTMVFTGMKVLKHDSGLHHGNGIHPNYPATRSRQGIAEGVDELLVRALNLVKSN